jgi:F0F1-type ATP synthase membrane subunit c/vacuolar-type H+-ATPase subunit K
VASEGDREKAIEAIAQQARANRPRSSRGMWIAAALVVVASAIAFVVVMFVDADPSRPAAKLDATRAEPREPRAGLATGIAIGLCAGIAIGFALARRKHADPR